MKQTLTSRSLRFRLLAGTLLIVTSVWLAVSLFAWRGALQEADQLFDAHLAQSAAIIVGLVGKEPEEIADHLPQQRYARTLVFQVWSGGTSLLVHSSAAPRERLAVTEQGFADSNSGGKAWRVYSIWDDQHHHLVQVAEAIETRGALSHELAEHLLYPLAIALPLLALALVLMIRSGLTPLLALAQSIERRSPDRLEAIALEHAPRELHPVVEQLNRLMARLHVSLDTERRFTADAAHELRTPLAAIRAHAQIALQSQSEEERERTLHMIVEASDHATRLTEQLLMLARLDAEAPGKDFVACDLQQLAIDALAQTAPFAFERSIELARSEGMPTMVSGNPVLLTVMLRNLIDNAVRYSPRGGCVVVSAEKLADGGARLEVLDQGPGIPVEQRQQVRDRFVRLAGSEQAGAGLGLSIVARIAEIHHAGLKLDTGEKEHGLRISLMFPPPHVSHHVTP
jgi:two-component system sensor histidine kinase QseC